MRHFSFIAFLSLVAGPLGAQQRDTLRQSGSIVSGVVYDSVSRAPLGGATVQLAASDSTGMWARTALSNADGRYRIEGVPAGRYTIGFFHPMLDSLGLEPPLHGLLVRGEPEVRADLAIPSATRIAYAVCGPRHSAGGALVMGIVRDARTGEAVSGVEVIGEWLEFTFSKGAILSSTPRLADTTRANGWFALCDVPSPGRISLAGIHGDDRSDRIEVEVTSSGFLRRDLYIGAADSSSRRVTGTVVSRDGSRPLRDVIVGINGFAEVRTNERGEFALDAPSGTRVLEIHGIGYYPERVTLNVIEGTPPVRVALYTMRAMLDTIRVVAKRTTPAMLGFEERRRSGMGHYLDAAYIERRHAVWTSELFRMVPGVMVTGPAAGSGEEGSVMLRAPVDGYCTPAFYVDGAYMGTMANQDLDAFVDPKEIAGIEIYRAPLIPAQFMGGGMTTMNCGAVVVWTNPAMTRSRYSFKRRMAIGSAFMATGYLMGQLLTYLVRH